MIDRDRDNRDIDRWIRGNLLEELAHTISKFKTCLNLPSASGKKTKKAGGVIPSRCKGLRTKGSVVEFYCLSARSSDVQCLSAEEGWTSWRRGRENLPFLCLFVLRRPSMSWMMSAHTGEGNPLIQMLISLRNTITDTSGNNALPAPWAFLLAHWSWYIRTRFVRYPPRCIFTLWINHHDIVLWPHLLECIHEWRDI